MHGNTFIGDDYCEGKYMIQDGESEFVFSLPLIEHYVDIAEFKREEKVIFHCKKIKCWFFSVTGVSKINQHVYLQTTREQSTASFYWEKISCTLFKGTVSPV